MIKEIRVGPSAQQTYAARKKKPGTQFHVGGAKAHLRSILRDIRAVHERMDALHAEMRAS